MSVTMLESREVLGAPCLFWGGSLFAQFDLSTVTGVIKNPSGSTIPSAKVTVRIEATGSYKLNLNESLSPNGYPTEDPKTDMAAGSPCGGLIGLVISPGETGKAAKNSRPFFVGEEREFKPQEDGTLYMRVNVPPSSKCVGKLKLKITGNIGK